MRENNHKSPWLLAVGGALTGIVLLAGAVGIYNYISPSSSLISDTIGFIAQQNIPLNHVTNNNTSIVLPQPAPIHPFYYRFFSFVLNNLSNTPSASCSVDGTLTNPFVPGTIDYTATVNPSTAMLMCGLIDHTTKQLIAVAPINFLTSKFDNLPVGSYDVVCLSWAGRSYRTAGVCMDGTFDIVNTPIPNPTPIPNSSIDLELYGSLQKAPSFVGGNQMIYSYKVTNQLGVSGPFTLRVYPNGLSSISASGAYISGSAYIRNISSLSAGSSLAFELQGVTNATTNPTVIAELCDYSNDIDSKPCNIVNMTINGEDDEQQL